jgi:hypothetical protein
MGLDRVTVDRVTVDMEAVVDNMVYNMDYMPYLLFYLT